MDVLLQQILNGLILGSLYALVALGYTMVYGIVRLIKRINGASARVKNSFLYFNPLETIMNNRIRIKSAP